MSCIMTFLNCLWYFFVLLFTGLSLLHSQSTCISFSLDRICLAKLSSILSNLPSCKSIFLFEKAIALIASFLACATRHISLTTCLLFYFTTNVWLSDRSRSILIDSHQGQQKIFPKKVWNSIFARRDSSSLRLLPGPEQGRLQNDPRRSFWPRQILPQERSFVKRCFAYRQFHPLSQARRFAFVFWFQQRTIVFKWAIRGLFFFILLFSITLTVHW